MEKKTKKILLLSAGILLVGGGIGYWLWRRNQTPKEESNVPLSTDDSGTPSTSTGSTTTPTASGPSDVKAFQDWMDKNHPNWVKGKNLNKGSGYGSYGPSTQAAWKTYKDEFQKPMGNVGIVPKPMAQTSLISKGQNVYPRLKNIDLFQYPAGNSLMGKVISNDLTKPIGVFDSYVGDFAKIWMNKSGVKLNGMLLKAPYWAYVYKSMVKK